MRPTVRPQLPRGLPAVPGCPLVVPALPTYVLAAASVSADGPGDAPAVENRWVHREAHDS